MKNKILIVDDSNFNRELLHDILSDDYEILMAEDGIIAKQIIEEKQSEIKIQGTLFDIGKGEAENDGFVALRRQ